MREMAAARGAGVDADLVEAFTVLRFRALDDDGSVPVRDKPPTNAKPAR